MPLQGGHLEVLQWERQHDYPWHETNAVFMCSCGRAPGGVSGYYSS